MQADNQRVIHTYSWQAELRVATLTCGVRGEGGGVGLGVRRNGDEDEVSLQDDF